jgi:translation initiation factor 6 (eIF-6)
MSTISIPVNADGHVYISQDEIQIIADAAAEKAVEKIRSVIYEEVGKSVLKWLAYLIGAVVVGSAMWLSSKGALPK